MPEEQIHKYGIVAYVEENGLMRLTDMVEKPSAKDAPSNLAMMGRYVFTPRLMELLHDVKPGRGNEIQLTDAIAMLAREEPVYGVRLQGQRFDAGSPEGFLLANAILGMQHEEYGPSLRKALKEYL